jgi:hypothetical protein
MGKREDNAVIVFLGVLVGIAVPLIFFLVLRLDIVEGKLRKSTRDNDKSALILREERKRLEEVLERLKKEKDE